MLKGIIKGNIVSTRKQETLVGAKFMEVEILENGASTNNFIVAGAGGGAGIGETVLITTGSPARLAYTNNPNAPVDAVIVGIVD